MSGAIFRSLAALILALLAACGGGNEQAAIPAAPDWSGLPAKASEAVQAAHKTFLENPYSPDAAARLAMLLQAYEQWDAAERFYAHAERTTTGPSPWPYLAAYVQEQRGDTDAADESYRRAVSFDPSYLPARLRLAALLHEAGNLEEAEELYRSALELDSESATAEYGLGVIAAARGDDQEAITRFRRSVALSPEFSSARYALAQALSRVGEEEAAKREMAAFESQTRVAEVMVDPLLIRVQDLLPADAPQLLARGKALEDQGLFEQAIGQYQRALQEDPDYSDAYVNLMSANGALGDLAAAERSYQAAVDLGADQAELYYNLGVLRSVQERFAEAVPAFEKALQRDPGMADAHTNLGFCLEQVGRRSEAARHYQEALRLQPNDRLARYHYGRTLLEADRPAEAAGFLQDAVEPLDERSAQILYTLADAQVRQGRVADAQTSLQTAYRIAQETGQDELLQLIQQAVAGLSR